MRKLVGVVCLVGLSVSCGDGSGAGEEPRDGDAAVVRDAAVDPETGSDAASLDAGETRGDDADIVPDATPSCEPNDTPELCDGVDNDCDPSSADGVDEPTLAKDCDGADGDLCSEGTVQCVAGGLVCSDSSDDTIDVCDGRDNDCDGQSDEACTAASFVVQDFAVDGAGRSVAVGVVANKVRMMCFGRDGAVLRDAFDAGSPDSGHNIFALAVARSRSAGNIALAFSSRPNASDNRNYVVFFDRDCQPLTERLVLDVDYPNTGPNRRWTVAMTDDGRSYVLYENYDAAKFRTLVFDATGARTVSATLSRPADCAGDQRAALLALDAQSGAFAMLCETNTGRAFRRFGANGSPLDASMRPVPNAQPDSFSFNFWGAGMNRSGALLYFGRTSSTRWIFRPYGADGQAGAPLQREGTTGFGLPRAEATSTGHFLIQQAGPNQELALVDPQGTVSRSFATSPLSYRLDAEDNVYVLEANTVVRSRDISLR